MRRSRRFLTLAGIVAIGGALTLTATPAKAQHHGGVVGGVAGGGSLNYGTSAQGFRNYYSNAGVNDFRNYYNFYGNTGMSDFRGYYNFSGNTGMSDFRSYYSGGGVNGLGNAYGGSGAFSTGFYGGYGNSGGYNMGGYGNYNPYAYSNYPY